MNRKPELTKILHIRVTEQINERLQAEAQRTGLRVPDVARVKLAEGLAANTKTEPGGKEGANEPKPDYQRA